MRPDFDGNGTTDLALRRAGVLFIDTHNDGEGHEAVMDLGWVGDAGALLAADFSGTADHRAPASVGVVRGDRCLIQGVPPGATPPAQP